MKRILKLFGSYKFRRAKFQTSKFQFNMSEKPEQEIQEKKVRVKRELDEKELKEIEEKKQKALKEKEEKKKQKEEEKLQEKKEGKTEKKQEKPKEKKKEVSSTIQAEKPNYVDPRLKIFDEYYKKQQEEYQKKSKEIKVTLPDGTEKEAKSFINTPYDIALSISKGLAQNAIVAKVDGKLWDLGRVFEGDCKLEILKWDNEEAKEVFWHSSSHLLGEAIEYAYQSLLCKGPPLPKEEHSKFYYDSFMDGKSVSEQDFIKLKEIVQKFIDENQKFERLILSKSEALEMFKYNKFKYDILSAKVPEDGECTVYRCGNLIDPCRGPHLYHSGYIKAFELTKNSSTIFETEKDKSILQRVYGVAFPDKKLMKEWQDIQEILKERDHRLIGLRQELWTFNDLSPGCVFMLPRGQRIFNKLLELIKKEYRKRGFEEVQTPTIFNCDLFKTSGHYDNYKENMFLLKIDNQEHSAKPMNCPGHCLLYKFRNRSYRELPIRFADFGVLHRNELKGALTGMTRVRRFQQDDAHIFCREDQIEQEIKGALEFLESIYGIFGFTFKVNLSTRPEKDYLGKLETWDRAEKQLAKALDSFGKQWGINKGDGAFYGPKIDIKLEDALKREHQCGTIQLDFNLPERFGLEFSTDDTNEKISRPVMIHRAIYGSLERFMAIISEQYGGKWPFWLSPRQIIVIPVSEKFADYAQQVKKFFFDHEFYVDLDESDNQIGKKIRNAQIAQYNYIFVVGAKEQEYNTINLRIREDGDKIHGEKSWDEMLELFKKLTKEYK